MNSKIGQMSGQRSQMQGPQNPGHQEPKIDEEMLFRKAQDEYFDLFPNIICLSKNKFISSLEKYIKISQRVPIPKTMFTKIVDTIIREYYEPDYLYINQLINRLTSKNCKPIDNLNYTPHCSKTAKAVHSCKSVLFELSKNYLICLKCKQIYDKKVVLLFCEHCNLEYYSSFNNEGEENQYKPATWLKYHCAAMINDTMKCNDCKSILYINMENKNLKCFKCKYERPQQEFEWKCLVCKELFKSDAKVYNPLEFKLVKMKIKQTIFDGIPAFPYHMECRCIRNDEINDYQFFHKKECNGLLFEGFLNKRKIIVCGKCRLLNYYENNVWTCPLCYKRFKLTVRIAAPSRGRSLGKMSKRRYQNEEKENRIEKSEKINKIEKVKLDEKLMTPVPSKNFGSIYNITETPKSNIETPTKDTGISRFNSNSRKTSETNLQTKDSSSNIRINHKTKENFYEKEKENESEEEEEKEEEDQPKEKENNININLNVCVNIDNSNKGGFKKRNSCFIFTPNKGEEKHGDEEEGEGDNLDNLRKMHSNKMKEKKEKTQNFNFNPDDLKVLGQIGQGTFGKIFKVESEDGHKYAMKKILTSTNEETEAIEREYQILLSMQSYHLNLIKIYGMNTRKLDMTTYAMYVLMDLAKTDWEKEIEARRRRNRYYSEDELCKITKQLVSTFAELQRHGISHRDIKPQNILITEDNCFKISDFGEAKRTLGKNQENTITQTIRGTELYMSPILFRALREDSNKDFVTEHNTFKSDVFSLGFCIVYAATLSFNSLCQIRELTDMISIKLVLKRYFGRRYTSKLLDILYMMIEVDEKNRKDFVELENYTQHL